MIIYLLYCNAKINKKLKTQTRKNALVKLLNNTEIPRAEDREMLSGKVTIIKYYVQCIKQI